MTSSSRTTATPVASMLTSLTAARLAVTSYISSLSSSGLFKGDTHFLLFVTKTKRKLTGEQIWNLDLELIPVGGWQDGGI